MAELDPAREQETEANRDDRPRQGQAEPRSDRQEQQEVIDGVPAKELSAEPDLEIARRRKWSRARTERGSEDEESGGRRDENTNPAGFAGRTRAVRLAGYLPWR